MNDHNENEVQTVGEGKNGALPRKVVQSNYRKRQREKFLSLRLERPLAEKLEAQMASMSSGSELLILTPDDAAQILQAMRAAANKQLPGFIDRPGAKKKA
ncbi:hypothetical protein [Aeromonas jandaei]|uniref:hypothetical protein n=1 Tax=Aeromonas jandaei TaxID=650 RepID=UPI003BA2AAEC